MASFHDLVIKQKLKLKTFTMKKWKIFLIIISPLILYIILHIICILVREVNLTLPISSYQTVVLLPPSEICAKIQDSELQKLCFINIENDPLKIDWKSLKPECGSLGWCSDFHYLKIFSLITYPQLTEEGTALYLSESRTWDNLTLYCQEEKEQGGNPKYNIDYVYCQAILVNPHWCTKTWEPPGVRFLIPGIISGNKIMPGPAECYHDAALIWKDPSLCEKTKDKDFCYLRVALLENSNLLNLLK